MLSDLVELGLNDPPLPRMYVWQLQQAGALSAAVDIFEKARRLHDDEPSRTAISPSPSPPPGGDRRSHRHPARWTCSMTSSHARGTASRRSSSDWNAHFSKFRGGVTMDEISSVVGQPARIQGADVSVLVYEPGPGMLAVQQLMDGAVLDLI